MITTKMVPTYTATIYVGMKERTTGFVHPIGLARNYLAEYCDRVGLCVTLTPTEYIYTNGGEPGFAVGLINYPRFPTDRENLQNTALAIAEELCAIYRQGKVTVVFPDQTVMIDIGLYGQEK